MQPPAIDILNRISAKWTEVLMQTVAQTAAAHQELTFYIAAFHMFFADGAKICPPVLAMNDLQHLSASDEPDIEKYAAPEWRFDVLDSAYEAMGPIYDELIAVYSQMTRDEQDWLYGMHDLAVAGVSRLFNEQLAENPAARPVNCTDDFFVAILEGQRDTPECNELVIASTTPDIISAHAGLVLNEDVG